ncbi:serine arginine-rich splicing factor rs2z32-like isoform 1 [Stylonychia lemnae]|uniref:Serine arginine-rich splicing factor rs2z32-like isoform 1 n=1 Tax=Stylonychia lemnae TaxID=5949 RepID=A0A078AGV0_STYLE|nr:serine arginine-rich splicing factor rs2z32-like isoform 1 [Stylonychia lemnae]|eukprot:CDW81439.1 serine arginine-rich splicing factor rs2z32-like isoform 1 [Stylonychia lemnae]
MSLFVGNISRSLRQDELHDQFDKFVILKGSYAFVEFKDERDAEDAIADLNNKELGGQKIAIEWSKKSGKYDPKSQGRSGRGRRDSRERDFGGGGNKNCFNCGKPGHFARDCRSRKRSRSSRRGGGGGGRGRDSPRRESPRRDRDSPRRDRDRGGKNSQSTRDRDSSRRRDDSREKADKRGRSNSYPKKVMNKGI